jgi:hypothetical protein
MSSTMELGTLNSGLDRAGYKITRTAWNENKSRISRDEDAKTPSFDMFNFLIGPEQECRELGDLFRLESQTRTSSNDDLEAYPTTISNNGTAVCETSFKTPFLTELPKSRLGDS